MIISYLLFFAAGLLGANGVPHFVKGITGEKHMTPFGKPSGAIINALWGTVNLTLGFIAWWLASDREYNSGPAIAAFFMGVLITALLLAALWEDDETARGKDN